MCNLKTLSLAALTVLWSGLPLPALSQSPFLNPQLFVEPQLPLPGAAFDLRIRDLTGVVPQVLESSIALNQGVIEIRASIELGYIELLGSYEFTSAAPALPEGIHLVRYFARTKRPDTALTDYFLIRTWTVAIVRANDRLTAIEYYHASSDHYFATADAVEIAALDAHTFQGWARTGHTFGVIRPAATGYDTAFPVCRFYGLPSAGLGTHFYTGTSTECALLSQQPSTWLLESSDVFRLGPIDLVTATCAANLIPVFRLWNGLPTVNHRYTTSMAVQQQMQNAGWIPEGSGSPPAVWCALPPPSLP